MAKKISQLTVGQALSGSELFEMTQNLGSYSVSAGAIGNYCNSVINSDNKIINGNMDIWQRGTSSVSAPDYGADRWYCTEGGTWNYDIYQSLEVPTVDDGCSSTCNYSLLARVTTANASPAAGDYAVILQRIEGCYIHDLLGQNCVLSFWVKCDKTGTFCVSFRNDDSDRSMSMEYTINSSDVWEYKEISFYLDDTGTWSTDEGVIGMSVFFSMGVGTNFVNPSGAGVWADGNYFGGTSNQTNAMDTVGSDFRITKVQLQRGKKATPFHSDIALELKRCQRYYQVSPAPQHTLMAVIGIASGNVNYYGEQFNHKMCKVPSVSITGVSETGSGFNGVATGDITVAIITAYGFRWNVAASTTAAGSSSIGISYTATAEL